MFVTSKETPQFYCKSVSYVCLHKSSPVVLTLSEIYLYPNQEGHIMILGKKLAKSSLILFNAIRMVI
jgi:hypothetical protein